MKLKIILSGIFLGCLLGCTAVTQEETAVPLATATPEAQPMIEETPQAEPNSEPDLDPTPTSGEKQVSEPVTVNLGDVTPVPLDSTPIIQPAPGNPGLKAPVVQAMTDLSQRLNVSVDDIELVSLLEVTWRDGSLGCPEADMGYIQALVPGQQLILGMNGQEYYYHSGQDGVFKFCSDPVPPLEDVPMNPLEPIPGQDD